MTPFRPHLAALAILTATSAFLTGCGAVPAKISSTPTTGQSIQGRVHGGSQAVGGAHIYLFAAGISGYGGPSTSLLKPTHPGVYSDATGAYVLTDAAGSFSIGGAYSCTPGQQVYILATGGNPGLAPGITNPAIALMVTLGQCPSSGNLASTVPVVDITEVSTVAAVYALAGYITDGTHVSSSGSDLSATGIANAFQNVNLLVDIATGDALSVTPLNNGSAPQATINTLANLLSTCVNSPGNSTSCNTLFSNAKDSNGVTPTDTATAVVNIAHNPAANIPALFTLANAHPPFQPSLGAAPNDWTVAVTFYSDNMAGPYYPAIDAAGNVWIPAYANSTLQQFSPSGLPLTGYNGLSGNNLNQPYSVAIDRNQIASVANFAYNATAYVSRFDPNGAALGSTPCGTNCTGIAIDSNQNDWVTGTAAVATLFHSNQPTAQFTAPGFASGIAIDSSNHGWSVGTNQHLYRFTLPGTIDTFNQTASSTDPRDTNQVAIDSADNVWFTSGKSNSIGRTDRDGKPISPTGGYKGGGLNFPAQLAIDGANRVWVANRDGNSISAFNNDGTPISPAKGFQPSSQTPIDPTLIGHTGLQSPHGLAIDGSGNIWVTNFTANSVTVFLGLATPTITPISPTTHGQRP
jgi:sugar lactone lactonase YvrE